MKLYNKVEIKKFNYLEIEMTSVTFFQMDLVSPKISASNKQENSINITCQSRSRVNKYKSKGSQEFQLSPPFLPCGQGLLP